MEKEFLAKLNYLNELTPGDLSPNGRFASFVNLKWAASRPDANQRLTSPTLIADGAPIILKAFQHQLKPIKILAVESFYQNHWKFLSEQLELGELFVLNKNDFTKLVGHQIHQGIMGEFLAPPETPYQQMQGDIIVVDGLKHVENIGSIIRSGVELKMKNFVFLNGSCHPLIRRAVRVSMGACFSINYQVIEDQAAIGAFISHFHAKKYQFVAIEKGNEAVPSLPSVPIHQIDCRNTPLCLILGSEVGGIGQELLTFHNQVLPFLNSFAYLPASAEGNYLNVAIASALVFYEVWRQRFHFS